MSMHSLALDSSLGEVNTLSLSQYPADMIHSDY